LGFTKRLALTGDSSNSRKNGRTGSQIEIIGDTHSKPEEVKPKVSYTAYIVRFIYADLVREFLSIE
jgi:hypothetical protein